MISLFIVGICWILFGSWTSASGGPLDLDRAGSLTAPPYALYLPLIKKSGVSPTALLQPGDVVYVGAFRLPGGDERPQTFAYGGGAMTFNPSGNPAGPADGYPGSLFIMGHERMPYGDLPDGNQLAEVSIPIPKNTKILADLNTASFIQNFRQVDSGLFTDLAEIPRIGLQYLNHPATGPKIHLSWGQHFQEEPPYNVASHAWFNTNLSAPALLGAWYIGNQSLYSVNDYLLEIPAAWADQHAAGRYLGTGRYREGGWSGMGPALFAYRPWQNGGSPPAAGTHLPETVLLLYEKSSNTPNIERCLQGYQHPDDWTGAAWITTGSGKAAVAFAGTKGTGTKFWYGYVNPDGPQYTCTETDPQCYMADGSPCPPTEIIACPAPASNRGWWSTRFDSQLIFYDPADLARVASGEVDSWTPQPYAFLDLDDRLLLNPPVEEEYTLGTGDQRRYRLGDITYDRANNLLYILELFADNAKPVVHVWRVQ